MNEREMSCIESIDLMGPAAEDRLDPRLVAIFRVHLGECPSCSGYFDQLCHTRQALLLSLSDAEVASHPGRRELIERFRKQFEGDPS